MKKLLLAAACLIALSACQAHNPRTGGALIGGLTGGLLGNTIGKGSGKTAATVGGAILGTIVGSELAGGGHGHGGGHGPTLGALGQAGEDRRVGQGDRPPVPNSPLGDGPPQGQSPLDHVLVFCAVLVGPVVGGPVALQGRFGDLIDQVEPLPEGQQLVLGHLLDLVGGVPCLEALAQRPALDGLGQNHRGGLVLLGGVAVRGVDLLVVVAAPRQIGQLLVREVLDHGPQAGIRSEEVLPDVVATLHGQALVLTVDRGVELVEQDAVHVLVDELVPFGSPDHLQDVPACTPEYALQLLDYLAVATDRAVQALQVAVDDPDQVAEA